MKFTLADKESMNYAPIIACARHYPEQKINFEGLLFIVTPSVLEMWVKNEDSMKEWPVEEGMRYKNFLENYRSFIEKKLTMGLTDRDEYRNFSIVSERLYVLKIQKKQLRHKRERLEHRLDNVQEEVEMLETHTLLEREKKIIFTEYREVLNPSSPVKSLSDEEIPKKSRCCCLM